MPWYHHDTTRYDCDILYYIYLYIIYIHINVSRCNIYLKVSFIFIWIIWLKVWIRINMFVWFARNAMKWNIDMSFFTINSIPLNMYEAACVLILFMTQHYAIEYIGPIGYLSATWATMEFWCISSNLYFLLVQSIRCGKKESSAMTWPWWYLVSRGFQYTASIYMWLRDEWIDGWINVCFRKYQTEFQTNGTWRK